MNKAKDISPARESTAPQRQQEQAAKPPEKQPGRVQLERVQASAMPPPDGSPSVMRAGEMIARTNDMGSAGRARMTGAMQGQVGNARISRMMEQLPIQARLTVNHPGDVYEQEADQMAEHVMLSPKSQDGKVPRQTVPPQGVFQQNIQRNCPDCPQEKLTPEAQPPIRHLQRDAAEAKTPEVSQELESKISRSRGNGQPLPQVIRSSMEPSFGHDLSAVRVHTGTQASSAARDLNAEAFTIGQDIYFGEGRYQPESTGGQKLIAHEVTHTIQQGGGGQQVSSQVQRVPSQQPGLIDQAVSLGQGLVQRGRGALISLVRRHSPEMADFIERGPMVVIREHVERAVQGWLTSLESRFDIQSTINDLRDWLGDTWESIQNAAAGEGEACGTFARLVGQLFRAANRVIHSPAVQAIRARLMAAHAAYSEFASLIVQGQIENFKFLFGVIKGIGDQVSSWARALQRVGGQAWDFVAEQLGLNSPEGLSIINLIKTRARMVWDTIRNQYGPAILRSIGEELYRISGLRDAVDMIRAARFLITSIQWLWEHRNDPDLVESARRDPQIGRTILPQVIEAARNFSRSVQSAIASMEAKANQLARSLLQVLEQITGLPVIRAASGLVGKVHQGIESIRAWAQENLPKAMDALREAASKIWQTIKPIVSVISLLLIGIANPALFPVIVSMLLGAAAWKLLPDCYKPPIIDFLLGLAIEILDSVPDVPLFGPMWSLFKPGLIAFLKRALTKKPDEKIRVVNKIAEIMLFSGIDFILGFVWGLLKGIWEGITDPIMIVWWALSGMASLVEWIGNLHDRIYGAPTSGLAPALGLTHRENQTSTAQPTGQEAERSAPSSGANSGSTVAADLSEDASESGGETAGGPGSEAGGVSLQEAAPLLERMISDLKPPFGVVRANFLTALQEYLRGSPGATFESVRERLGELWSALQGRMQREGSRLADRMFITLLGPQAMEVGAQTVFTIGEGIGWLVGTIAIEIIIAILSVGTVSAAKGIMKVVRAIAKVLDVVGDVLGLFFRLIGRLARLVGRAVRGLGRLIRRAGQGAIRVVMEALEEIAEKLQRHFDEFMALFRRGRRGAGSKLDDVINRTGRKASKDLTRTEVRAELRWVTRNRGNIRLTNRPGYTHEVTLPNGHTWSRNSDGRWCRASNDELCFIDIGDDLRKALDETIDEGPRLVPRRSPLREFDIDSYGSFSNRPGDALEGHEMLQNAWLVEHGFSPGRGVGRASLDNPAVAVSKPLHNAISREQRALGLFDTSRLSGMTAEQVIEANALAMQRAGVPNNIVQELKREALRHARSLPGISP